MNRIKNMFYLKKIYSKTAVQCSNLRRLLLRRLKLFMNNFKVNLFRNTKIQTMGRKENQI